MRRCSPPCARGQWTGRASQLSEDHVEWTFIDEIAAATRDPGRDRPPPILPILPILPIPPILPDSRPPPIPPA